MTRRDFDDLVRRIEARYQGRPAAMERTTAAWIRLGQGAALAWVALFLALGAALFAGGVALPPEGGGWLIGAGVAAIVYAVAQACLYLPAGAGPEEGRVLRAGEAPTLTALLDELRGELACRPFGEVRLSMRYNAGIRETPGRRLVGPPGSSLDLGLPLMLSLTPEEFRAVLAHEFAHHSARYGRGGRRVGRLTQTWDALTQKLQGLGASRSGRSVRWAAARFLDWYGPRFRARAVVLSRLHEFQADRIAAEFAGAACLASALWRMECVGLWLSDWFWVDLQRRAADQPEPPDDVLTRLGAALAIPPAVDQAARWADRVLTGSTGVDDTHPAYAVRVRALGVSPEELHPAGFPLPPSPTAAETLLGAEFDPIACEPSRTWSRSQSAQWRERHRRSAAESRRRDQGAAAAAAKGPTAAAPDVSALWESARETVDLQGFDAALPALRAVLDLDPLHAGAAVLMGHHLVDRDAEEGERLLWSVLERNDQRWMKSACESLQQHYRATGQAARLQEVRSRLDRFDAELELAGRERATVTANDALLEHGLTDEQLAPLRSLLVSQPGCTAAWLARKELHHFPERPLFLLCVRSVARRWGFSDPDRDRELARRLMPRVELPGQVLVITRHGNYRHLAAKLQALRESKIYAVDRITWLDAL